jgi:hypothetical protein
MPKKTLPFRLYAQVLIFTALVGLGGFILWSLQQAVYGGIVSVRDNLISRLEHQINRKIRYSSISPSIFGSFDVRNVSIVDDDERPVLTIHRFRVTYSLMDLLRGRTQAIRSVRMDSPLIDFNTARDIDLLKLFENLNAEGEASLQNFTDALPGKLIVQIRQGKCLISNGRDQFDLDALNLNIEIANNAILFNGRWDTGIGINRLVGDPISLSTAMRINGSCRVDMEEGEAVFSIPSISGDILSVTPISFGLDLRNGIVRMWKMSDQLPFDFSFEYGVAEGNIGTSLYCRNVRLGEFLSFSGGLEKARQFLDISGSGNAFLRRKQDGSLDFSVNMAGASPKGVDNSFRSSGTAFEIKATGDEKRALIETLHLSMPTGGEDEMFFYGDLRFSGSVSFDPFTPEGTILLEDFSLSGVDTVNAHITMKSVYDDGPQMDALCESLTVGQTAFSFFSVSLRPSEKDLWFSIVARCNDDELAENPSAKAGLFSLQGSMNTESRRMEADLRMDTFSAGDIVNMMTPFVRNVSISAPVRGLLDTAIITTEVSFTTDFEQVQYNAPQFVIESGAAKYFTASGSISGTDRSFTLTDGRLNRGNEFLMLSGTAELTGSGDVGFLLNAGYRNLDYAIEGSILGGRSVSIKGAYGLNVNLTSSQGTGYSGYMRAENFPIPFMGHKDGLATLSLAAQFSFDTSSWSMNFERFEADGVASPAGPAQIRVSGKIDNTGANLPLLFYRDSLGPLNGMADFFWESDFSGINGTAMLSEGNESYRMNCLFKDRHLNLTIFGSSMRLDRLAGSATNTLANGDIRLSWDSPDSFEAVLNLSSVNGRLFSQEFRASARAVLNNEELVVVGSRFNLASFEGTVPHFAINRADGTATASAEINGSLGEKKLESRLSLAANIEPVRSWLEIDKLLSAFAGNVHVEKFVYSGGEPQSFNVAFSRTNFDDGSTTLSVTGGPRDMFRLRMDQNGNFYAGLANPFPVRGTVIGSIRNKIIDAHCGDLYVDLAGLFAILPDNNNVYMHGGYASASIDIRGSITDPEFFGTARGTSLRMTIPEYITRELRPIPFNVSIEGNEAYFGPIATSVGNGAGSVEGWFRFDRWIPNIFSIDILVPRETPIPYGLDITGFIARGNAYGKVNVSMENLAFDISGDIYVNNTELGVNADEISKGQASDAFSSKKTPFVANITINTGPMVEFLYPSSNFPILRANPDIGTKVHVTVDSLARQFSVTSDVRIRGGEIFYFERSFYIRSGTLSFRENELRFSPRLTARAEVRERTDDGPVTISMIVDNAPLLSFTARFESSPSLSQMEIFTILGFNITGTQYDDNPEGAQRAFLNSSSDLLAQFVVVRQLEQQIRNLTRLDMFSVRTQVLQNYLFTRTGLIQSPVDRNPSVGNYFDNTTVYGGKYIGQDMFVQGMLSMRYDANNPSFGGLTVRPDIGVELQNPLFSIRWDFFPTHPENWYVNDNSITLTWSRSF